MAEIVEFITPQKVILKGLTLGNPKAKTWYIFIHGLGGNMLSMRGLTPKLIDNTSSVLLFNNRGHDIISRIKKIDKREKSGYSSFYGGAAHEIFTDCVDDIQGAVDFVTSHGAKKIILVGHSTGSQKAIYYLSKKEKQKNISHTILLSPLSDFAGVINRVGLENYESILKIAKALVDQGSPHVLLPSSIWPEPIDIDAQRFLSLYTPVSDEDIFSYPTPDKKTIFSEITLPITVILGEKDEYSDRPISEIKKWFDSHQNSSRYSSHIIRNATHGFDGTEDEVAKIILSL
ncbi:MAG TPA: alpha/beta fold hydrolase [Candidatus Levybacteria bacterium]|nr:alpha/beta fold hydrolase [Candidatus Levybacteria bacterium]